MLGLQWPSMGGASHALHTRPPTSHTSRVREPSTRPNFAIVLGFLPLAFAFAARREQVLVLGVGEGRGGEGRAGLGWAGLGWAGLGWAWLGCGGSPQLSLLNVPEGACTITNNLSLSSTCSGQSGWQRIACLACGCNVHAGHYIDHETEYANCRL